MVVKDFFFPFFLKKKKYAITFYNFVISCTLRIHKFELSPSNCIFKFVRTIVVISYSDKFSFANISLRIISGISKFTAKQIFHLPSI